MGGAEAGGSKLCSSWDIGRGKRGRHESYQSPIRTEWGSEGSTSGPFHYLGEL